MEVTIRAGGPADLPAVEQLCIAFETWLGAIEGGPGEVDPTRTASLGPLLFGDDSLCRLLVAEDEVEIVGYLIYYFGIWMGNEVAPCLHVADLFVAEAHRGRGIGRALMTRAREIASGRGAREVFWTVWRRNRAAQGFYRHLGAEPFADEILMRWPG